MTPAFSLDLLVIFSLVVGVPVSTNAEPVKVMDEASPDGSFTIAQTNGMNRRQDRRDDRQDCRQQEVKLTRFRGHRTVCVQGVHDGQDEITLPT